MTTPEASVAPVTPAAPESSSWGFSMPKIPSFGSSEPEIGPDGNTVERKSSWNLFAGGKRHRKKTRMRGGSFRPFVARSVAATASPFKGGRRRKTRRTKGRTRKGSRKR